jgi:hypothetical protein
LHECGCPYKADLRSTIVRKVLLPKWREAVRARGILFYWHEQAGRASHAPGGVGRKRDREAFEADFA